MSNTLTRAYLANVVSDAAGVSSTDAADIVDAMFEEVIKTLENEEEVKLSSFGTFEVRSKNKRVGRNPKTKVEVVIEPRRVVSFKASAILKSKINPD
jgi:integration host factor subunit alpha